MNLLHDVFERERAVRVVSPTHWKSDVFAMVSSTLISVFSMVKEYLYNIEEESKLLN